MHNERNKKIAPLSFVLNLSAILYKTISLLLLKIKGFKPRKFPDIKIISINNLSFGGTGKSSAVLKIGEILEKQNIAFSIITRGYKSAAENTSVKVELTHTAAQVGDEAVMFKHRFKNKNIFSGKRKTLSIQQSINLQDKIIIIDDGFQSTNIEKNLNIMLFNQDHPFYYTRNFKFLIKDSDLILSYKKPLKLKLPKKTNSGIYNFRINSFKTRQQQLVDPGNKPILAFSALGDNQRFKESLADYNVIKFIAFPDHHKYTIKNLQALELRRQNIQADYLVCTVKDFAKISNLKTRNIPLLYVVNEICFDFDMEKFLRIFLDRN
jgi:tetraacyldisaccharide 4'-kinase